VADKALLRARLENEAAKKKVLEDQKKLDEM
jgi:hypothetical protein